MRHSNLSLLLLVSFFIIGTFTLTACSSSNYKTNIHEINEEFNNISVNTDTADIAFIPSNDSTVKVACYENAKKSHSVEVQNSTLTISTLRSNEKWYNSIYVNKNSPKITVYLPASDYASLVIEESTGDIEISKDFAFKSIDVSLSTGDVKCYASVTESINIVASTGDIYAENISANSINLTVTTGDVNVSDVTCDKNITIGVSTGKAYLTDIACQNFSSTGRTGDITLRNVIATEKCSIERSTGNVTFENSDATELFITTSTGNVEGTLLTEKVFITKTGTGHINVPNSITGGRCEITTTTGNIKMSISNN